MDNERQQQEEETASCRCTRRRLGALAGPSADSGEGAGPSADGPSADAGPSQERKIEPYFAAGLARSPEEPTVFNFKLFLFDT